MSRQIMGEGKFKNDEGKGITPFDLFYLNIKIIGINTLQFSG